MSDANDAIRRGKDAEALVADERFQRVLRETEDRLVEEWKGETTKEKRENLHAEVRALRRFMGRLKADITHGKIATESERTKRLPI